jgi:CTP synthase (UTP-ammonia lyase)
VVQRLSIGIVGNFDSSFPPHPATNAAIKHAGARLGIEVEHEWLPTEALEHDLRAAQAMDALWCAPGSPYRSMAGALRALRYARESQMPTLGTCGGCQHIIIEFARTVLGIEDAQHAEYDPYASRLIVSELACSPAGQTMPVTLEPRSTVAALYRATRVTERYYCNFGLNPEYRGELEQGGLRVAGWDDDGEVRVLELPGHPFYFGTLFVPQMQSTPEAPHPLVVGLLEAARSRTLSGAPAGGVSSSAQRTSTERTSG